MKDLVDLHWPSCRQRWWLRVRNVARTGKVRVLITNLFSPAPFARAEFGDALLRRAGDML